MSKQRAFYKIPLPRTYITKIEIDNKICYQLIMNV